MGLLQTIVLLGIVVGVGLAKQDVEDCLCPECGWSLPQLAAFYGYALDEHQVTTLDGLNLTLFRLHYPGESIMEMNQKPGVLLQHGLLDSSATWMLNLPNQSLAYILVDSGFDVWMSNSRGNVFSMPPCKSKQCWEFSFHEMGLYDVPANVDYITETTNRSSIGYVGHSQGTSQMFIQLSMSDRLAKKINMFVAMAPVGYVGHQSSTLLRLLARIHVPQIIARLHVYSFLPRTYLFDKLSEIVCRGLTSTVCEDFLFMITGRDNGNTNLNSTRMALYMNWNPAGTSTYDLSHWLQLFKSQKFQPFDYGPKTNKLKYGTTTVPGDYPVERISTPMAFFSGGHDSIADPVDVKLLKSKLKKGALIYEEELLNYDHMDFVWGLDAQFRIYGKVEQLLRQHASTSPIA